MSTHQRSGAIVIGSAALQHGVHWLWLNGCSKQGGVRWNVKQIREDHKFRPHNRRKHDIPTSPFER